MTAEQEQRIMQDLIEHAGETVRVEQVAGALYAFGSELACLRIFGEDGYELSLIITAKNSELPGGH